jgi:hypothetical protein
MSATKHLQRRLFYTARELADFIAHDDVTEPVFRDSDLFQQHIYQSKGPSLTYSGLRADIEKNGVQRPVRLHDRFLEKDGVPTIMDGHHRIAIANDVNPDMYIPVEYVNR